MDVERRINSHTVITHPCDLTHNFSYIGYDQFRLHNIIMLEVLATVIHVHVRVDTGCGQLKP